MARKHNLKRSRIKQEVTRVTVKPEKRTVERKVLTNPNTGEIEVKHIVHIEPAVVKQGRASGPTVHHPARLPHGKKPR